MTGVVYSKPVEKKDGKKDPTKSYEFKSIVIEVDTAKEIERDINGEKKKSRITKKELVKLDLASWLSIDDLDIGNTVEVDFFLEGSLWTNGKGEQVVFTKPKATYVKLLDRNGIHHEGKVADNIAPPLPRASNSDDDDSDEPLPF